MLGKGEASGSAIDTEDRDVVPALIAGVKEAAGRVEITAAWIISTGPFVRNEGKLTIFANGEYRDAVVQSIADVNEGAIAGNKNFRAEITARESGRKAGDGLPGGESTIGAIVVEQNNIGAFFLKGIKPASVRMEMEMTRAISGRK